MKDLRTNILAYDVLYKNNSREKEREWVDRLRKREWMESSLNRHLSPGVSVIVPAYKSSHTLIATLQSLITQTLSPSLYEIIIICNGPHDGSLELLEREKAKYPDLNLRIFDLDTASAGAARNIGLDLARFEFITFVDADDQVEENFLSSMLSEAGPQKIIASPIVNVSKEDSYDSDNILNQRICSRSGTTLSISEVPWILGFNACKLIPTHLTYNFRYAEDLKSGEDLVFFANFLSMADLYVTFPKEQTGNAYLRFLSEDSVSRQSPSFDFNVMQRAQCILALQRINATKANENALTSLINAQLNFIRNFFAANPADEDRFENELATMGELNFPWRKLNSGKSQDLAISYCFSPFADTSAVVAEKAIAARKLKVDVISNNMSSVRETDHSVAFLSSRWIENHVQIDSPPSFSDWEAISKFALAASRAVEELQGRKKTPYRTLYSRALWVGSHVAAVLVKNRYPSITWTAEFSDPLRFGVDGSPRPGSYAENDISQELLRTIATHGFADLKNTTLFDLVEACSLLLADEVIFTNTNQMDYMLANYPDRFAKKVQEKSKVRPHPTPSPASYHAVPTAYQLNLGKVNIGFFGSFYINRGLGDIFSALINMPLEIRKKIAVHIFCNTQAEAEQEVADWGLRDVVIVNKYLPYMEFLNASTKFDVLLVNDVQRGFSHSVNPFLPSKLSDYRGSGAKIWGLIDEESPLSREELDYQSPVGNSVQILKTLTAMVNDHKSK